MDVLVVGAGPTGLTLACGLLRQGVRVRVVDKAAGPATTSRALVLHARGAEILGRLGALGPLRERAITLKRSTIHAGGRPIARLQLASVPGATPMMISQAEIEGSLRATLEGLGGSVEWNTELCEAVQDDHAVSADLSTGEQVQCGWLVGCDGAHSRVRALAGLGFSGESPPERFLLADVEVDWDLDHGSWLRPVAPMAAPRRRVGCSAMTASPYSPTRTTKYFLCALTHTWPGEGQHARPPGWHAGCEKPS